MMVRERSVEHGPSGCYNHGISKSRTKKKIKCYKCGKIEHLKKECWSNQKRREGKDPESLNTSDDGDVLYS